MGVIDEHLVEALEGEPDPGRRRLEEKLHGALVAWCPRRGQQTGVPAGPIRLAS
jgi:hypothetical protein